MTGLELVLIAGTGMMLIGFICLLLFCAFVVIRTGDTAGLRDVAAAVRAYAAVAASLRTSLRSGKKP